MIREWLSARRMGLRDKGKTESWSEGNDDFVDICSRCNTRTRIGIDRDSNARKYCWRCECFISESDTDPKEPEDIPEPEVPVVAEARGDVKHLDDYRKAS